MGRGEDCSVLIPHKFVSRRHAKILVDKGSHFIMDLRSYNKTFRQTVGPPCTYPYALIHTHTHTYTQVTLKPNIYYELKNNMALEIACVPCTYLITESSSEEEETQTYAAEEVTKNEAEGRVRYEIASGALCEVLFL